MKRILSSKKTAIVLMSITLISLIFYVYMIARPISFGMEYHNESVYEDWKFEGITIFNDDNTMLNRNSNFIDELRSRYYYKDGYVFFTMANTSAEYEKEVEAINADFEEALKTPFYASKINAFRFVSEGPDGYTSVYLCESAIIFAAAFGAVELIMICLSTISLIFYKKSKIRN
jgi:hypothetical protein